MILADALSRSALRENLLNNIATITFTKRDGAERVMKCTLVEDYLPPKDPDVEAREPNLNTLTVWDLEKNDWRTFRMDSIKRIVVGTL